MNNRTDSEDDRFVEPTDRSQYELMRAKHLMVPVSAARKARWCGYLLFVAALTAPIVFTLPEPIIEAQFIGDPIRTPLGAAAVASFGVLCLALAGIGLGMLARLKDLDPPESRVWTLIGLEDALTGIGFITGFLGVVTGVGILAIGHTGVERTAWFADIGVDPYLTFGSVPVTPLATSALALVAAVVVVGLSLSAE